MNKNCCIQCEKSIRKSKTHYIRKIMYCRTCYNNVLKLKLEHKQQRLKKIQEDQQEIDDILGEVDIYDYESEFFIGNSSSNY